MDDIEQLVITSCDRARILGKDSGRRCGQRAAFHGTDAKGTVLEENYRTCQNGAGRSACWILQKYGFDMEMGHKEVGGVKANLSNSGSYDHVMEQLEIDWKYSIGCPGGR